MLEPFLFDFFFNFPLCIKQKRNKDTNDARESKRVVEMRIDPSHRAQFLHSRFPNICLEQLGN